MKFTARITTEEKATGKTYKGFEIMKTWEVKEVYNGTAARWYGGYTTATEKERVSGSVRYFGISGDEYGAELTEEFKTIKEVKNAIDNGEYWG